MKALIGGGTGFIGKQLQRTLEKHGYVVTNISRQPGKGKITWKDIERSGLPKDVSAVINLAGENLMNPRKRWNAQFISELRSSRIDSCRLLASAISSAAQASRSCVWVSASGVGYYPLSTDQVYNEESVVKVNKRDVLQQLVIDWEAASSLTPEASATNRHVIVRLGVVLGRTGGMIQQIYLPFSLGLGGRIGDGKQFFSWVHVSDVSGIILHALKNDNVKGVLNAIAPSISTNSDFTQAFAQALGRPAVMPVPGFVFNAMYGAERAQAVLAGAKVEPKRTLESGYKFIYPDLKSACEALVKDKTT